MRRGTRKAPANTASKALAAAAADYRDWFEKWRAPLDRKAFGALRKAVRALEGALAPFEQPGACMPRVQLQVRMQIAASHQAPQAHYWDMVRAMREPLLWMRAACDLALDGRHGGGQTKNEDVYTWVMIAADAWQRHQLGKPSATDTAPFWSALQAFQASAAGAHVPKAGQDVALDALKFWRKRREA